MGDAKRGRKPRRKNAVAFLDVENIRSGFGINYRNEFPGDRILEQLREIPDLNLSIIFAVTNNRDVLAAIEDQRRILQEQGFIPIVCGPEKPNGSDMVDETIHDLASFFIEHTCIDAIILASADRDFKRLREKALNYKKGCIVYHTGGHINKDWEQKSKAVLLRLSELEENMLSALELFAQKVMHDEPLPLRDNPGSKAMHVILVNTILPAIQPKTASAGLNFTDTKNTVYRNIPEQYRHLLSPQLIDRALTILVEKTDLLEPVRKIRRNKSFTTYKYNPDGRFSKCFPSHAALS